jgi:predicted nucleic acid-binding Zn ribbon protein
MAEYICPHCKNPIYDDEALLCLYCGESLNRPGKRIPRARFIFVSIILLIILGFVLSMFLK